MSLLIVKCSLDSLFILGHYLIGNNCTLVPGLDTNQMCICVYVYGKEHSCDVNKEEEI
jgi:hypothetical protein